MTAADRRAVLLVTIAAATDVRGYPPTIRELAAMTRTPAMTVQNDLRWLADGGYIERTPGVPRAIRVLPRGLAALPVANASERTAPRAMAS